YGARHPVIAGKRSQTPRVSEWPAVESPVIRWLALACATLGCLLTFISCTAAPIMPRGEAALVQRSRVSMGTAVQLSAWTTDEAAAVAAFDRAFLEFDRLDALMSVWKEGSDILRINA